MNTRYEVIISWSDDDDCFVADVPELPSCMADGSTHEEAAHNAENAIREWLETAADLGRPIPQPKHHARIA
jgi:predicted RNase H-like HicB family nuclease